MDKQILSRCIFVLLAILLMVGGSDAQLMESPWAKFAHDNNNSGKSEYSTTTDGTNNIFYQADAAIYSGVVIDMDGIVYFATGTLYAVYPNKTIKWAYPLGQTTYVYKSSPTLGSDGTIYIGLDNYFLAVNPNGTLKWDYYVGEGTFYSSATIDNDTIYFNGRQKLIALNMDGTLKWEYSPTPVTYLSYSPATDGDGTIYISTGYISDGRVFAVNPNGTEKWIYTHDYNSFLSSPVVDSDGTIYVSDKKEAVAAINPDGTQKWVHDIGTSIGNPTVPAIGSETLYVTSESGNVSALYKNNGTLKWQMKPTIGASNYNLILDFNEIIYLGDFDLGNFDAIYPNGTLKFSVFIDTNYAIDSSPAIDSNGKIYTGTGNGTVFVFESQPPLTTFDPSGYVKDNLGNPISNADITFWKSGFSILTTSDSTGYYNLNGKIADGFYDFIAMKDGHGQAQGSGTITNGGSLNINFTLYSGDPCPGFVCGLVGRYNFTANSTFYINPQVGFTPMSNVTVNLWNDSYTASNLSLSWGYYQIPVYENGTYSITANKSSYVTRGTDTVTVTNNSALKYLFPACLGDINFDENINVNDFVLFSTMYNSNSTSNNYFNLADLNNDSKIDVNDFVTFATKYNSQCTEN